MSDTAANTHCPPIKYTRYRTCHSGLIALKNSGILLALWFRAEGVTKSAATSQVRPLCGFIELAATLVQVLISHHGRALCGAC